jgi:hypothetical protein
MNTVVHACLGLAAVLAVVNLFVALGKVTKESPRIAQTLFAPPSAIATGQNQQPAANLLTNAGQPGLSNSRLPQTNQTLSPAAPSGSPMSTKLRMPG